MSANLRCALSIPFLCMPALAQDAVVPEIPEVAGATELFHYPTTKLPPTTLPYSAKTAGAAPLGGSPFSDPGVGAFQVNLTLGLASQPITIPVGKRLVIDFIAVSGTTASPSGPIQPIVILASGLKNGSTAGYYVKLDPSTVMPTQYYRSERILVYADTLTVSSAYSGFAPSFFVFNVALSGHLIDVPLF